jgi:hypothetical protein
VVWIGPSSLSRDEIINLYERVGTVTKPCRICFRSSTWETEFVAWVILENEVLDNCTGLPDGVAAVRAFDIWKTAVRADSFIYWLLYFGQGNFFTMKRNTEFFQHDGDFGRVGTSNTPVKNIRFEFMTGHFEML